MDKQVENACAAVRAAVLDGSVTQATIFRRRDGIWRLVLGNRDGSSDAMGFCLDNTKVFAAVLDCLYELRVSVSYQNRCNDVLTWRELEAAFGHLQTNLPLLMRQRSRMPVMGNVVMLSDTYLCFDGIQVKPDESAVGGYSLEQFDIWLDAPCFQNVLRRNVTTESMKTVLGMIHEQGREDREVSAFPFESLTSDGGAFYLAD